MQNKKKLLTLPIIGLLGAAVFTGCSQSKVDANNITQLTYNLYKENGGQMSYDEWLRSIKGDKGPQGDQGAQGDQGDQGPQGDKGTQGDKGPQGDQKGDKGDTGDKGTQGPQGASIYSGESAPEAGLGKDLDAYINTKTGEVFQKINGEWTVLSESDIRGPKGATGTAFLVSDSDTPDKELGKVGDSCITPEGKLWYYSEAGWTYTGVNIKGNQGDKGDKGDKGDQGPQGNQGEAGASILCGVGEPSSTKGRVGDHYIDAATGEVYEATSDGTWFKTEQKISGAEGTSFWVGKQNPPGDLGNDGDHYMDSNIGLIWEKVGGAWKEVENEKEPGHHFYFRGKEGDKGDTGEKGDTGKSVYSGLNLPTVLDDYNIGDIFIETRDFTLYTLVLKNGVKMWSERSNSFEGNEVYVVEEYPTSIKPDFGKVGDVCIVLIGGEVYKKVATKTEPSGTWVAEGRIRSSVYYGVNDPNTSDPKGSRVGDIYICTSETDDEICGYIFSKISNTGKNDWKKSEHSIRGPRGYMGEVGSKIYQGTTKPTAENPSDARIGDYYIFHSDTESVLYYKQSTKGDECWALKGNLKGNKYFFGSGDPNTHLDVLANANIGDVYLDKDSADLYMRTSYEGTNQWVKQTNLRVGATPIKVTYSTDKPPELTPGGTEVDDIYIYRNPAGKTEWYRATKVGQEIKWVYVLNSQAPQGPQGDQGDPGDKGDAPAAKWSCSFVPFTRGYVVMVDSESEAAIGNAIAGAKIKFQIVLTDATASAKATLYLNETSQEDIEIQDKKGLSKEYTMPENGFTVRVEIT